MQPRNIYTDQDAIMGNVVDIVFTYAYHELCTFHIMQNVVKHISPIKGGAKYDGEEKDGGEREDKDKELHILTNLGACMCVYEDNESLNKHLPI
jgi:zinc finger SWIM domain-containing protein 3